MACDGTKCLKDRLSKFYKHILLIQMLMSVLLKWMSVSKDVITLLGHTLAHAQVAIDCRVMVSLVKVSY